MRRARKEAQFTETVSFAITPKDLTSLYEESEFQGKTVSSILRDALELYFHQFGPVYIKEREDFLNARKKERQ